MHLTKLSFRAAKIHRRSPPSGRPFPTGFLSARQALNRMTEHRDPRFPWIWWGKRVGIALGVALLVAGSFWFGQSALTRSSFDPDWPTRMIEVPPRSADVPVAAADVGLSPEAAVLGVSFAGRHRAYPVSAMSDSISHVMNDQVGGQPLTVAYCDRTNCARAFTSRDGQSALDLAVGGWLNEGGVKDLIVRHGRSRYELTTGRAVTPDAPPFPFETVDVEQTTWGEWRAAHPDTDLVPALQPPERLSR